MPPDLDGAEQEELFLGWILARSENSRASPASEFRDRPDQRRRPPSSEGPPVSETLQEFQAPNAFQKLSPQLASEVPPARALQNLSQEPSSWL